MPNGDEYEGDLIDGRYNGYGELKFANGDIYKGYFKNDSYDGKGVKIYFDWKEVWWRI